MNGPGIAPDQGPPLSVPLTFFFTAPLSLGAVGFLLIWRGHAVLMSGDAPATLLLTHLGTLGFLTMVMFGAFFQMAPVIASARVPAVRFAHAVHVLLTGGLIVFALGALGRLPLTRAYRIGFTSIELAVVVFLVLAGIALARTRMRSDTVVGLRLVLASLLVVVILGTWMELAYGGSVTVPQRGLWIQAHATVALLGWVGGLIGVVAWEVLPMFYLAEPVPPLRRKLWLLLTFSGVASPLLVLLAAGSSPALLGARWVAGAVALPAVAAVWVLQPIWLARALQRRKRRRVDASVRFWQANLVLSPLVAVSAIVAAVVPDPRAKILFVYLAVWGWAGLTVHGMLVRIVPFLVWFHRFSPLIGKIPVPSMRALLPETWVRWIFRVHVVTLGIGAVAVLTRWDVAARALGVGVLLTATIVLLSLIRVVRARPMQ